ncbi:tetratricopeptide repeat protein [Paraburkholderia sp. MMS20-SJTR3]|uniref:Tetratricopeptide repeat protein n=1 Tax=Paraburkholderia sejongensis TaxID=2886946 RepID=A0ABS8JZV0_9BURK|nr:tetratricopeptide repeat protein [Paraburkholderia sp. MMS20-SJTR3]MCC8395432.1 tetratricopeptide repeat protein [Paraburkholderia sp. MMS20-SJTR3]
MSADAAGDDGLCKRGVQLLEAGDVAGAETCLSAVAEEHPDFPLAQYHLGLAALRAGQLDTAERHFRAALERKADFAAAYNNLGDILMRTGRLAEAEQQLRRASVEDPALAEAFYNLGTLMLNTGRSVEAEACLHRAIVLRPNFAHAYNNLCEVMLRTNRRDEAESCVRKAVELAPDFALAHYNLGNLLLGARRAGDAEASLRRALELQPDFPAANHRLGTLLLSQNRASEAETLLRRQVAGQPQIGASHRMLGITLLALRREQEALGCLRRALELDPRDAEAHYHLGGALLTLNRLEEAVDAASRGYALAPELAGGRLILGSALLKLGRYREGWPHYEYFSARRGPGVARTPLAGLLPEWQGEPLAGKALIMQCDFGFGPDESIQFARFFAPLKASGLAHLTFVCPPEHKLLFDGMREIDTLKSTDEHVDPRRADYWCYLTSLPLRLDVTLERLAAPLPYLRVASAQLKRWQTRLDRSLPADRPRIGIAGAGELPVSLLQPLLAVPGVSFVALGTDARQRGAWRELPAQLRPADVAGEAANLSDLAALVRNLDLVITADPAIAHLAGALNRPFWLLLKLDGDWRWLHARSDSPWYPQLARLFRQREHGDWSAVIDEAAAALPAWIAANRSVNPGS